MTIYQIRASFSRDGQIQACDSAEVLGPAYGLYYATEGAAQAEVDSLQESLDDTDLDPTTEYSLVDVAVEIATPVVDTEDGAITLESVVRVDGRRYDTLWYARPTHTTAGIAGCEPSGPIDAWTDSTIREAYGDEVAVAIGREVCARAPRQATDAGCEVRS